MTAPGWYPDPHDPAQARWWDGQAWSAHVQPAAPPTGPVPTGPGSSSADAFDGDPFGTPDSTPGPVTPGPFGAAPTGAGPYGAGPYGAGPYGAGPYGAGPYAAGPYGGGGAGSSPFGPPAGPAERSPSRVVLALLAVPAIVVGLVLVVLFLGRSSPSDPGASRPTRSTTSTTERLGGPTGPGGSVPGGGGSGSDLEEQAALAEIPVLDAEGVVTHTHTLVRVIWVNPDGTEEDFLVDEGIGIDARAQRIAAVHTHDETGVVHVESPHRDDTYTIGQFLTLWTGQTGADAICEDLAGQACTLRVDVVAPTPEERRRFERYGPMPATPPVDANGLDTVLGPGAVIEVRLELAGPPNDPGQGPAAGGADTDPTVD